MKYNHEEFTETSIWKSVKSSCDYAVAHHEPVFVFGASQIGKTWSLLEYEHRAKTGSIVYVRVPASPSFASFVRALSDSCGKSASGAMAREHIFNRFSGGNDLLIVDEMHTAFIAGRHLTGVRIAEFIREIHDRTGIGVVYSGTQIMMNAFSSDMILEQTIRRGIVKCRLPDMPPKMDVALFAAAAGLPDPDKESADIIARVLAQSGIGQIRSLLRAAANFAKNKNERLEWKHFRAAYDVITNH